MYWKRGLSSRNLLHAQASSKVFYVCQSINRFSSAIKFSGKSIISDFEGMETELKHWSAKFSISVANSAHFDAIKEYSCWCSIQREMNSLPIA